MPKIPINGPLSLSQNIPNVDGRFGPYTSVAEANEYLGPAVNPTDEYDDVISAGMLFGVYEDDGSVTICMWTKDHATVNDFKRISHAQVVQFNGIVTGIVSINQSSGATAKTASDIKYLEQNKKFGYLQGSGYIVNWVNRYIWADSDQNPYQDVLYLNIATNALYYYTGTALVALTAGSQGSLVTSVNGQTGAVTITIPTKLSDLTNDVGFITNAGVTSFNGQTGAVTYTPPVTSVNNKTGAVVLDKTDVGLGNVDNTPDANKQVYSAIHDGSGNPIDETYETKTHATAQHSLLQSNIDSLANVAANLTGLDSTNFGGFSLAVDAATAVSNIPTVFTQNGCTVGQPYWFLAGPDMSALVAYRYIGSGTPAAISATEYDFTDFSRLSEQVKDFKGTITTLSAIDDLHNVADVGVYHVKVSQFSGLLIVEKFNDGLNTTITQQLIASGTPVNQGGSYTIERGQTLARRAYSSGAWTSWTDPIAELQANVAALGPKIYKAGTKRPWYEVIVQSATITDGVVTEKTQGYCVSYCKAKLYAGDVFKFVGVSSSARNCKFGFTATDPSSLETIVGLHLSNITEFTINGNWNIEINVPFDGYIVFSWYNASWTSRNFDVYRSDGIDNRFTILEQETAPIYNTYTDYTLNTHGPVKNDNGYIGFGTSQNYYHSSPIPVNTGEKWYVKTYTSGSNTHLYNLWFADANDKIIDAQISNQSEASGVWHEIYYIVPDGATKMYVVCYLGSGFVPAVVIKKATILRDDVEETKNIAIANRTAVASLETLLMQTAPMQWDGHIINATISGNDTSGYVISAIENMNYQIDYKYCAAGSRLDLSGSSSESTARAAKIGISATLPAIGNSLTNYAAFSFPQEGATAQYVMPIDGYLVIYRYRLNWATYIETYTGLKDSGNEDKYLGKIMQAYFRVVTTSSPLKSLGLLHYSDLHGDDVAADTILSSIESYANYIDDVICTGDSVHYYADGTTIYPQDIEWWQGCGLPEKSLFVIGNHDGATSASTTYDQKEDSAAWDGKGEAWEHDNYIAPYAEDLGIVLPSGYDDSTSPHYKALYWHKDYPDSKIRVIGLDCLHRFDGVVNPTTGEITMAGVKYLTNEQELWLIAKLNETLDSTNAAYGYSVIFACHYPLDGFSGDNKAWSESAHKFVANENSNGGRIVSEKTNACVNFHYLPTTSYAPAVKFNMNNRVDNGYSGGSPYPNYKKGTANNFASIIETWIGNGGKYIAWLCGHTHMDMMYYPADYPDLLVICIDQAGNLRGSNCGDTNLEYRTCANYYAIDPEEHLIKVVRIGRTMGRQMVSKSVLCYDWDTRKVIIEG